MYVHATSAPMGECPLILKLCIIFQAGEMVRKGKDGALHLRQIRHYIETGAYLASVHLTEKNGIRKSAKKFVIEGICRVHNLYRCAMSCNHDKFYIFSYIFIT